MPGGHMHLESMGDMDDYLIVNPGITFFKSVYSRYINFSQELMSFQLNGSFGFGNKNTITIPRNGDLIGDLFLEVVLSNTATHCYGLGNALVESAELTIGGQDIESICERGMNIIGELTQSDEKRAIWDKFVGNHAEPNCNKLLIPLPFFCSDYGKYIQLIALSYHECRINFQFASREKLMLPEDCKIESIKLVVNYIYLDTEERRRVAGRASEFIISSVCKVDEKKFSIDELNPISTQIFDISHGNHPTSELFWIVQNENGQPCQSVCLHNDTYARYTLRFNNNNSYEYEYKPLEYAHLYNPYLYNTNTPRTGNIYSAPKPKDILESVSGKNQTSTNTTTSTNTNQSSLLGVAGNRYLKNGTKYNQYIYSHSFSFDPDNSAQPAGTINLSRLDKLELELQNIKLEPGTYVLTVYQRNFNVLRYSDGMAGLAYCL